MRCALSFVSCMSLSQNRDAFGRCIASFSCASHRICGSRPCCAGFSAPAVAAVVKRSATEAGAVFVLARAGQEILPCSGRHRRQATIRRSPTIASSAFSAPAMMPPCSKRGWNGKEIRSRHLGGRDRGQCRLRQGAYFRRRRPEAGRRRIVTVRCRAGVAVCRCCVANHF